MPVSSSWNLHVGRRHQPTLWPNALMDTALFEVSPQVRCLKAVPPSKHQRMLVSRAVGRAAGKAGEANCPNPLSFEMPRPTTKVGLPETPGVSQDDRCPERSLQAPNAWLATALSSRNRQLSFAATIGITFQRRSARRYRGRPTGGSTTKRSPQSLKPFAIWTTTNCRAGNSDSNQEHLIRLRSFGRRTCIYRQRAAA